MTICPAMVEGDISKKADLTWRADYMISTAESTWCDNLIPGIVAAGRWSVKSGKLV